MIIAVLKEQAKGESRVALVPESVKALTKQNLEVWIEKGAGEASSFTDQTYIDAGAKIKDSATEILSSANILIKVQKPEPDEIGQMKPDTVIVSFLGALFNKDLVEQLKKAKVTAIGLDAVPRITRAQKMDALSSMSSIAGYKAVLIAADSLGKYMPMMMTAAGTIPPARALVLGAGVAGLQAIATARRLGAIVEAFDVRPAVKEQVESLGAKFVEVKLEEEETETKGGYAKELSEESQKRQKQAIHNHAKRADIVITTALIPGKPAPLLITKETVGEMANGSVIIDLAGEQGGNCELTKPGETIVENGVTIHSPLNITSLLPVHASQLYSKNISALIDLLIKDGALNLDFEDEIIKNATITHKGEIVSPAILKGEL
ncbi:MAG TPA: Re/Si-specific NAD(P)(+) transhydrogenase subunit alpha [Balneolales bacterium]|nr:Re/Si-specific NAD(P)(+) transhydrogenase subunit alpha [Balneolales bacterium]